MDEDHMYMKVNMDQHFMNRLSFLLPMGYDKVACLLLTMLLDPVTYLLIATILVYVQFTYFLAHICYLFQMAKVRAFCLDPVTYYPIIQLSVFSTRKL